MALPRVLIHVMAQCGCEMNRIFRLDVRYRPCLSGFDDRTAVDDLVRFFGEPADKRDRVPVAIIHLLRGFENATHVRRARKFVV